MNAKRRWLSVAMIFAGGLQAVAKDQRANILFIYTDDQSYRTISCYPEADAWARTPNIDRLARQGMRFTHAYIGTWCMPSRASLLTGHHQFGIESMRMVGKYPGSEYDASQCPFWPKVFRAHGYVTAQIGKWHTGTDTGYGRDWDYQIVWNRPLHPDTASHYYYDQPVTFHGGQTRRTEKYSTDQYTDWAAEFIRRQGGDAGKPWYLWLCYGAVHGPYTPAKRHLERFAGIHVPTPTDIYPPRAGKPDWMQKIASWKLGPSAEPMSKDRTLSSWVRQYYQAVAAIDEGVGRVLAALAESGQAENTLVVFTSDQGFAWGQHGFRHKLAAYDANIRAPLIVRQPGEIPAGTVCKTPVGGIDLIPTFFNRAQIMVPWKMHGHDLSPLLQNPDAPWKHPVLLTHTGAKYGADTHAIPTDETLYQNQVPWYVMLRLGHYKYIRSLVAGAVEELYDLNTDPEELINLALSSDHGSTLVKFRVRALAELRRTDAGFVDHLPPAGK